MAENKVLLNIAGLNLLITTPEEEEYVHQIAQEIDESVTSILNSSSGASVTSAVLLCAIEYLDSAKKANKSAANMRTQIKEYMSEAANAKMLYDNELKKSTELSAEIQALRNHLTRIATEGDTTGILNKLKEEYNASGEEILRLRNANNLMSAQNKSLSEKTEAMNSYISGQDREIARLTAVTDELSSRLNSKTNIMAEMSEKLAETDVQITELTKENIRLANELSLLEQMIGEDRKEAKPEYAVNRGSQPVPVSPGPSALDEDPPAAAFSDSVVPEMTPTNPLPEPEPGVPEAAEGFTFSAESAAKEPAHSYLPPLEPVKYELPPRNRPVIDIDLSDLPDPPQSSAEPKNSGDDFKEYMIDEDDTVLGFRSVMNDKDYAEQEAARVVLESLTESSEQVFQVDTESFFEEPAAETASAEKSLPKMPPLEETLPEPKKAGKPRGKLEDIIENLDDDGDEMPNLSWTLDI